MSEILKKIESDLQNTANLLLNSGKGEKEKRIEVSFGEKRNSVVLDIKKFQDKNGNIVYKPKAVSQEKGRLLLQSQVCRNISKAEKIKASKNSDLSNLFSAVVARNSIEQLKNDWCGFSKDVDNYVGSFSSVNVDSKLKQLVSDWFFGNENELSDSVNPLLNDLCDEIKDCKNRIKASDNCLQQILEIIKEQEQEQEEQQQQQEEQQQQQEEQQQQQQQQQDNEEDDSDSEDSSSSSSSSSSSESPLSSSSESQSEDDDKNPYEDLFELEPEVSDNINEIFNSNVEGYFGYDVEMPFVFKDGKYNRIIKDHRNIIENIKKTFSFRNISEERFSFGHQDGDIDVNGLHKFIMGRIDLFKQKELKSKPKVTVGILLDQSGSMDGENIIYSIDVIISLVEALKSLKGIELVVYGHTERSGKVVMMPYLDKNAGIDLLQSISNAEAHEGNYDGFAIKYLSDRMVANNPISEKSQHIMLVLTDGEPAYEDDLQGMQHTRQMVDDVIARKQKFFAVGINNAFEKSRGKELFGNNFCVIKDVKSSLSIFCNQIRKVFC